MDPPQAHVPLTDERRSNVCARDDRRRARCRLALRPAGGYERPAAGPPQPAEALRNMAESELRARRALDQRCWATTSRKPTARPASSVAPSPADGLRGSQSLVSATSSPNCRREELFDIQKLRFRPRLRRPGRRRAGASRDVGGAGARNSAPIGAIGEGHAGVGAQGASTFRAALFGLNDGIVSNLALIAGVAGVAIGSEAVLVAGIGGWLAGCLLYGRPESTSPFVASQKSFNDRSPWKRDEVLLDPGEERRELISIYRVQGTIARAGRTGRRRAF